MVKLIGEEKYLEEIDIVKKLVGQEKNKGVFEAIYGAVDTREKSLKDVQLSPGF